MLPSSQMIIIISLGDAKRIGWPAVFIDQGSKVSTVFLYGECWYRSSGNTIYLLVKHWSFSQILTCAMQISVYCALFTLIETNREEGHHRPGPAETFRKRNVSPSLSRAAFQLRYPDTNPPAKAEICLPGLEVRSPLFIDAARSPAQIDTISPQMGLQCAASKLRSGYVEGLWHHSTYESPARVRSFVTSSFKVHLPVDLWCSMESAEDGQCESYGQAPPPICGQAVYQNTTVCTLSLLFAHVSDSPPRSPLWLHVVSVVSNKEEILVPLWPAHRGHREIYGVCLPHRECF